MTHLHHRNLPPVPMNDWGRDHWSLLAYVEARVVTHDGELDPRQMRTNVRRAARLKFEAYRGHVGESDVLGWKAEHGTRLRGHTTAAPRVLPEHCDCACLLDLEREGLITLEDWTEVDLTPTGIALSRELRLYRKAGGQNASFAGPGTPLPTPLTPPAPAPDGPGDHHAPPDTPPNPSGPAERHD